MFRLDKRKIFLLYHYYLLSRVQKSEGENEKERVVWFDKCLEKERLLSEKITKKLKIGWEFSRLPPLERAILIYAAYEMLFGKNADLGKMIISQNINFSKAYLEGDKYKYINKVLDLIIKESRQELIKVAKSKW
jgi:transcription termination factor NusB